MARPVALSTLPLEIFYAVAERLDKKDLFHLGYACRDLHSLCIPLLYRRLCVSNAEQLQQLVQRLLQNPTLAAGVHSLELKAADNDEFLNVRGSGPVHNFGSIYDVILTSSGGGENLPTGWIQDMVGNETVLLLLFAAISNLQSLHIQLPRHSQMLTDLFHLISISATPFDSHPTFQRLSSVAFDCRSNGMLPVSALLPFFSMSAVTTVKGRGIGEYVGGEDKYAAPEIPTSSVTNLELTSSFGMRGMSTLTSRCKNLKSFKYNQGSWIKLMSFGDRLLIPCSFDSAKDTLEHLWIEYEAFCDDGHGVISLDSFSSFTTLKTFHVATSIVLSVGQLTNFLPPSLEKLGLLSMEKEQLPGLLESIEPLLDGREIFVPRLDCLFLQGRPYAFDYFSSRNILDFRKCCHDARIDFQVEVMNF
ncbi:hypothetical protein AJ80_04268 [Polytolypa hystricis UAMH7299]|uniref:F-box domain-containing protein n=1 Tax=Polytolypa hystricis (strain UAMH7299) TaxID=1447883 RepID=A0A2B7YD03_POLH7|nr:hypothetical protein AJ80_04268 [Polytolypa hystricis UAMH7299]